MKRRVVTDAALKAAVRRNTEASARLEGREVPEEHVRSAAVERYLAGSTRSPQNGGVPPRPEGETPCLLTDSTPDSDAGETPLKICGAPGAAAMNRWDYRVVRSLDQSEYFIAEVYYIGDKLGWVGDPQNCLRWDRYDDLKGTVDLIRQAFNKPVLEVAADGCLVEEAPG